MKGCDNDPPVVSNYQNPLMNIARTINRDLPSTSTENHWIIENPATDNDNIGENGIESNGGNEVEQGYYIENDGDNDDSMVGVTAVAEEDEESLEEVSAEPIFSNPNSDEEDEVEEEEKSRDQEEIDDVEEEEDA